MYKRQTEDNANVAFAHFNYVTYDCGYAYNAAGTNGGELDTFSGSAGIFIGDEFVDNADGTYTLDLTLYNRPDRDSSLGILLVNGAKNENNYALSRANADGSFTIFCHDNGANASSYERDPVSFVFIPVNTTQTQIKAMGRIDGDGSKILSKGDFTVTKGSTFGTYFLEIPGHSNATGTLLITPEGGVSLNVDNTWSYEWSHALQMWEIHSRDIPTSSSDLPATNRQHIPSGEPAFNFVFIGEETTTLKVDHTAAPGGDGSSWSQALQSLEAALAIAPVNAEIWVAEGTYYPGSTRTDTFNIGGAVKVYGGFPSGGGDGTMSARNPDPRTNNTILSGDINDSGDLSGNSYRLVDASSSDNLSVLDGFTITGGNCDDTGVGFDNYNRGAGLYLNDRAPTLSNLLILENRASIGGGIYMQGSGIDPTFTNLIFQGNRADLGNGTGGAAYIANGANAHFINGIFVGNTSKNGVIHLFDASPIFSNCTFAYNDDFDDSNSPSVGGFSGDASSSPILHNCILWGNTGAETYSSFPPLLHATSSHNLIDGGYPLLTSALISTEDPLFTQTPSSGDGDWTSAGDNDYGNLRLQIGSPAKDAGNNAEIASAFDLDGYERLRNYFVDLGPYELSQIGASISIVTMPTTQSDGSTETIEGWVTGELFTGDGGYTYQFTQTYVTGDLTFDLAPTVDANGDLSYAYTSGTTGFASFQLIISDPSGTLLDSDAFEIIFRTGGAIVHVDQNAPQEITAVPAGRMRQPT